MIEHALWAILFIACVVLGIWEIARWQDPDLATVISSAHKRRRAIGLVLLVSISAMGYHQAGFPQRGLSHLQAARQGLFYMSIMLMVVVLLGIAYYEWKATLVEFAATRKDPHRSDRLETISRSLCYAAGRGQGN